MDESKNGQKVIVAGKTTCACGPGCTCGCGDHYFHRVIWWIVAIIVLLFVFALGVKAGEFRDELRAAFGGYYRGYPMMEHHGYDGGNAIPVTGSAQGSATGTTGNVPMIPVQE